MLVSLGANAETRNNAGQTPLLSSILLLDSRPNNLATIEYLIQQVKVNVNAEGEDGRTRWVGAQMTLNCMLTFRLSLHHAARMGILGVVKMLVEHGAVVDRKNVGGFTPLNAASFYGYADVVSYLLDKGAHPNMESLEGWVCLFFSSPLIGPLR